MVSMLLFLLSSFVVWSILLQEGWHRGGDMAAEVELVGGENGQLSPPLPPVFGQLCGNFFQPSCHHHLYRCLDNIATLLGAYSIFLDARMHVLESSD